MGSDALQRLEDQLAIRELVARYNYAIDEARPEEWVATFVSDGTFESTALGAHTVNGDDATARCYLIAVNTKTTPPSILTTAVYDDVLHRTPDGWRFVHRKVTPDTTFQH
jgi:hypothetical protein